MCEEHSKLFHAYQEAVALFSTTLNARQATLVTAPRDEYPRMTEYVEQARLASEDARAELDRHITAHGCRSHFGAATNSATS